MTTRRPTSIHKIFLYLACLVFAPHGLAQDYLSLTDRLLSDAPKLDKEVLQSALKATQCAVASGIEAPERLAVIDFSLPSDQKRLWVFDLDTRSLLLKELVAHGKNSGNRVSQNFSNKLGSHQSSIGLFQANETYRGKHGYSLRLDGLEPGINDRARDRAIVIHGADYVDPRWIEAHGRIGRSHGCPAVSRKIIRQVVDNLKEGQLLFTYYPDNNWLQSSSYLNCQQNATASLSETTDPGDNS